MIIRVPKFNLRGYREASCFHPVPVHKSIPTAMNTKLATSKTSGSLSKSLTLLFSAIVALYRSGRWLAGYRPASRASGSCALLRVRTLGGPHSPILGESDVHAPVIPLASQEQERNGQYWYHKQVENAEVDKAGRDTDPITSIRDTESNWV
ncbi:hypothetical protein FJTKL_03623 [Diaporthe vaccinii]|uniref:Uncharacterized protein n=1 Tax=Diaporthe vaccinii TaxID=105482 RepID=A0ABR4DVQ1_9PEZI